MAFTNNWDNDVGLICEFPIATTRKFKTLISTGESGRQRRRSKAVGPRTWSLVFNILTAAETELVWQFYQDCNGAYDTFLWTNPEDNVQYTVHFKSDELTKEHFQYNFSRISFAFEEII